MSRLFSVTILLVLTAALWLPVLIASGPDTGDYQCYVDYARAFGAGAIVVPHFAYPMLVYAVAIVVGWASASLITALLCALLCSIATFWYVSGEVRGRATSEVLLIAFVLSLGIVGPINMLTLPKGHLFRGYFSPTSYVSPSYFLLRPVALVLFAWVTTQVSANIGWKILAVLIMSVVCALVKPNYSICLIPTLAAILLIPYLRARIDWRIVISALVGSAITIAWQMLVLQKMTYEGRGITDAPTVLFEPFAGIQSHWLAPKLVLSLAFPVAILWRLRADLKKRIPLVISWIALLISLAYAYLLVQPGALRYDGHFISCVQITLFIVFVVSVVELLRMRTIEGRWPQVALILFALHTAGGVLWYLSRIYGFAGW